mmetsp:Transcript_1491/g.4042  ORF Transcript_1491/g.4042 Transcript_1491/m.4042 type:complete len:405 (-) Transcript_1491:870-2084(-)
MLLLLLTRFAGAALEPPILALSLSVCWEVVPVGGQLLQRDHLVELLIVLVEYVANRQAVALRMDLLVLEPRWQVAADDVLIVELEILIHDIVHRTLDGSWDPFDALHVGGRVALLRHLAAHQLVGMTDVAEADFAEGEVVARQTVKPFLPGRYALAALVAHPPLTDLLLALLLLGIAIANGSLALILALTFSLALPFLRLILVSIGCISCVVMWVTLPFAALGGVAVAEKVVKATGGLEELFVRDLFLTVVVIVTKEGLHGGFVLRLVPVALQINARHISVFVAGDLCDLSESLLDLLLLEVLEALQLLVTTNLFFLLPLFLLCPLLFPLVVSPSDGRLGEARVALYLPPALLLVPEVVFPLEIVDILQVLLLGILVIAIFRLRHPIALQPAPVENVVSQEDLV